MSSAQGRIARSFLALASGDALARVIAFLAPVVFARRMGERGPELYGVIAFANAVLLYFRNAAQCGIDLLGVRHVAEDERRIETVAPAILGVRTAIAVALALLLGLGALLFLDEPDGSVLALYGLTLIAVGPDTRWIHLGLQRSLPVAVARTLGELTFIGGVWFLVHEPSDVTTVPLSQVAGDLLTSALLFGWLRRQGLRVGLTLDWRRALPVLRRAFPLVLNVLLGLTIYNADLIFLRVFRDREAVGYYGASYQLISFMTNIAIAYSISLLPALTRVASDRPARQAMYHDSMAQVMAIGVPVAVGGCLFARPLIELVFEQDFAPSGPILAILVWVLPFTLSKEVDLVSLVVCGRERTVLRMTALAVGVNVVLNVALIPTFGMTGAAVATLITEAARAGIAGACARAEGFATTGLARLWRTLVASAGMAGVIWLAGVESIWVGVPLGAATYAALLAAVGGIGLRGGVPVLRV